MNRTPPRSLLRNIKSSAKMAFIARLSAVHLPVFIVLGLLLIHIGIIRLRVGQQRPLFDMGDEGVRDPLTRV